jgi:glycosyltransferase involved in cell wall biosynthesis
LRFNAYKSGLKAQTYSALGVPTVATDISYYRDVIGHGQTGFLVRTSAQWKAALSALHNDPELARAMGVRAYEREMQQTFESKVYLWNDLYTKERP